ncbi:TPA: hypothetical protein NH971_000925 [Pseudomonas aeruginosa]|nr:hypothetical protein [Pseudomonas aeruginosa]
MTFAHFERAHGSALVYWLRLEGDRDPFIKLHRNGPATRKECPRLSAACRVVESAPQLAQALADLAAASWLEPDPSDSDELAQAKRAALAALAAATREE